MSVESSLSLKKILKTRRHLLAIGLNPVLQSFSSSSTHQTLICSDCVIPSVRLRRADWCTWIHIIYSACRLTGGSLCSESQLLCLFEAGSSKTWSDVSLPLIWRHRHALHPPITSSLHYYPLPNTFTHHHPGGVLSNWNPACSFHLFMSVLH